MRPRSKFRSFVSVFWLPALILAAGPAVARGGPLDFPISIDLESAEAQQVLASFLRITGTAGEVDPEIEGQVTIAVENVSWSHVLDAICEGLGCGWELRSDGEMRLRIFSLPGRGGTVGLGSAIDLAFEKAAAREVLEAMARILSTELVVEEGASLDGSLTLRLEHVTVATALDVVCEKLGCRWDLGEGGKLVLSPVEGEDIPEPADAIEAAAALARPISMELEAAPAVQTLKAFGAILGVPTRVDPEVAKRTVTIALAKASAHEALNRTCALIDCRWRLVPEGSGLVLEVLPSA